jgi:flagellar protein FlaG
METKVTAFAATPDATYGQAPIVPPSVPDSGASGAPVPGGGSDLRLVIEEDRGSGSYVYKTIDRRTGEVLQSLPRADILKLRAAAAYAAGSVISTEA